MVQQILINKSKSDFLLSKLLYTWLITNKGWEFVGYYGMEYDIQFKIEKLIDDANDKMIVNPTFTPSRHGSFKIKNPDESVEDGWWPVLPQPVCLDLNGDGPKKDLCKKPKKKEPLFVCGDTIEYDVKPGDKYDIYSIVVNGVDWGSTRHLRLYTQQFKSKISGIFAPLRLPEEGNIRYKCFATPGGYVSIRGIIDIPVGDYTFIAQAYPGYTFRKIFINGEEVCLYDYVKGDLFTYYFLEEKGEFIKDYQIDVYFQKESEIMDCGMTCRSSTSLKYVWEDRYGVWYTNVNIRTDPDVIEAYKTLFMMNYGYPSGLCADIKLVTIPDDVEWVIRRDHIGHEYISTETKGEIYG
jgi:3D (Asp-Asp-Asp) domain-containing protein